MVHNVFSMVWGEHDTAQRYSWFTVYMAINTFQSPLCTFTIGSWCTDGVNVLLTVTVLFCMYSTVFCLWSYSHACFHARTPILFLIWNWHSQLLASMLHSRKSHQLVLITGIYLSHTMYIPTQYTVEDPTDQPRTWISGNTKGRCHW